MLKYNLNRLIRAKGIMKPFSFFRKQGLSGNFSTRLANDRVARLELSEIEKLCEIFQCTPNDLMEWVPSSKSQNTATHPLASLRRSNNPGQIYQMIGDLPIEKISQLEEMIRKTLASEKENA